MRAKIVRVKLSITKERAVQIARLTVYNIQKNPIVTEGRIKEAEKCLLDLENAENDYVIANKLDRLNAIAQYLMRREYGR
jgi:DNA invertase Pin-like site-specific DNA recombinase